MSSNLNNQQNHHCRVTKKRKIESKEIKCKSYYYHYTNESGYNGIKEKMEIRPSPNTCLLGEGVYFTTKPPNTSNANLIKSNYGLYSSFYLERTEYYIRIPISELKITNSFTQNNRDVHIFSTNKPLSLINIKHSFGQRKRYFYK